MANIASESEKNKIPEKSEPACYTSPPHPVWKLQHFVLSFQTNLIASNLTVSTLLTFNVISPWLATPGLLSQ